MEKLLSTLTQQHVALGLCIHLIIHIMVKVSVQLNVSADIRLYWHFGLNMCPPATNSPRVVAKHPLIFILEMQVVETKDISRINNS